MYQQRSTFRPSTFPLPKKIAFVLPGRITLSEHLPAEIISVATSVARRSKYLRKVIDQHALTELIDSQIRLPNIDSIGFRMYIDWLESGDIESGTTSKMFKGGLLLRDSFDYIFAHIAGSQLEDPDFQDHIIDTLTRLLDASQTPDLKVLERVFLEKGASNILRQFVVDTMFAAERRMLAKMRGVAEDSENGAQGDVGCKYHVHAEGECYRTKASSGYGNTGTVIETAHEEVNVRNIDALKAGTQSRWSSSSSIDSNPMYQAALYNMANKQYFGSEEWSRQVHGLSRMQRAPQLRTDKPLPTIPPLTPGTSPTPPDSPPAPRLVSDRSHHEAVNTELIDACLSRLQPLHLPERRPGDSPELQHAVIPSLVLECMERYQKAVPDSVSSYSSYSLDTSPNQPRALTPLPEQDGYPSPFSERSLPERHVHRQRSFESIPKPWQHHPTKFENVVEYDALQHEHLVTPRDGRPATPLYTRPITPLEDGVNTHRQPFAFPPAQNSYNSQQFLVQRKPAPPRGTDWLHQHTTLNPTPPLTNPTIIFKPSRKSRFRELLRSDTSSHYPRS